MVDFANGSVESALFSHARIPAAFDDSLHWRVAVDSFFHALAYQYVDMKLAENQLRLVLDHQREDGMLPDAVYDEGVVLRWRLPESRGGRRDKPPLIAWTALRLYGTSGNRDFLDEIYEPLCRWNQWWFDHNDDDHDGIAQYNHGFSPAWMIVLVG